MTRTFRRALRARRARRALPWLALVSLLGCSTVGPPPRPVDPGPEPVPGDSATSDTVQAPNEDGSDGASQPTEGFPPALPGPGVQPGDAAEGADPGPTAESMGLPDPVARDGDAGPGSVEVLDLDGDTWAGVALASLTLREKIAQLMMPVITGVFAPVGSDDDEKVRRWVQEDGVGGLIVSVGSPMDVAARLNRLQGLARIPLLVGSDLETGAGFRFDGAVHLPGRVRLGGATTFPTLMALGATGRPAYAYQVGRVTALEARALGIHMPFAPVLDVNNNPDNPIINVRSFGADPEMVGRMGVEFVRGVQDAGAIATGKHFPGHGDTETDSHVQLPVIRVTRSRLDSLELRPFRDAIEAGMGAVMSAHIALPIVTGGDGVPATLSPLVLDGILRNDMGFDGLVVTDALDMAAIDRRFGRGEAAVRALEAGADILLMPPNVGAAVDAVVAAVAGGRLTEARIDRSVERVLRAKGSIGLHRERSVDLSLVAERVGIPEHRRLSDEIAENSLTLFRNEGDLLPLRGTRNARVLSVTYRRNNDLLAGADFESTLRRTYRRVSTATVGRGTDPSQYAALRTQARRSDLVVVSIHVTAIASGGDPPLPEEFSSFVSSLVPTGVPHVVISFGNPYLIRAFPGVRAYLVAWGGSSASQVAAARALFGEVEISGRSPTAIPPLFQLGDGLTLPRRNREDR